MIKSHKTKSIIVLLNLLIISPATLSADGETYGIITLSNNQNFGMTIIDDQLNTWQLNSDKSVAIGLGVGYKFSISNDWYMKTELELSHSNSNIAYVNGMFENKLDDSSRMKANQVWASVYIQNDTYFESVNPFIGIGIGTAQLDTQFSTSQSTINDKDWQKGYQVVLGLELETEQNYSINLTLKNRQY